MRIIDTHLHLIYLDRFSYPWLENAPALNKQTTAEDYFSEAGPLGIEQALHMEVNVADKDMEAETDFMLSCHPQIVGAIANCRPEDNDFEAYLDRISSKPGLKGLRKVLHTNPDELSQTQLFAENIKKLANHNLTFDLCIRADQLQIGADLAAKCPDVHFILDHCGVPDIAGGKLEQWKTGIDKIAQLPNVTAKFSGIVAYANPDWSVDDLRPYAEYILTSFGWDRVVWGSDFPVCTLTADLTRWVNATHALIAGASEDEKAKLLHKNAQILLGL